MNINEFVDGIQKENNLFSTILLEELWLFLESEIFDINISDYNFKTLVDNLKYYSCLDAYNKDSLVDLGMDEIIEHRNVNVFFGPQANNHYEYEDDMDFLTLEK